VRQWGINPAFLCRKHLLDEHAEHHAFVNDIAKGVDVSRYLSAGRLNPKTLHKRHDRLVAEMKKRGYDHCTPLSRIDVSHVGHGKINTTLNIEMLRRSCKGCAKQMEKTIMKPGDLVIMPGESISPGGVPSVGLIVEPVNPLTKKKRVGVLWADSEQVDFEPVDWLEVVNG